MDGIWYPTPLVTLGPASPGGRLGHGRHHVWLGQRFLGFRRFDTETNQRRQTLKEKGKNREGHIYIYITIENGREMFFFRERCMYVNIDIFLQVVFNF